jgi:hypothetical protein
MPLLKRHKERSIVVRCKTTYVLPYMCLKTSNGREYKSLYYFNQKIKRRKLLSAHIEKSKSGDNVKDSSSTEEVYDSFRSTKRS